MSDNVIPLRRREEPKEQWASGMARCTACQHEWVAVVPVPQETPWLECPSCTTFRGLYLGPFGLPKDQHIWVCHCGNDLFYVGPTSVFCPGCGSGQIFGDLPSGA